MKASAVKRIMLLFWALWLSVIAATNLFSLLKALGLVSRDFVFASNNFALVHSYMALYHVPHNLIVVAFGKIVGWQWFTAWLFFRAFRSRRTANAAYGAGLALFAAFLVAGEVFLRFDYEAIHMRILIALLLSWLALHLVPDDD